MVSPGAPLSGPPASPAVSSAARRPAIRLLPRQTGTKRVSGSASLEAIQEASRRRSGARATAVPL